MPSAVATQEEETHFAWRGEEMLSQLDLPEVMIFDYSRINRHGLYKGQREGYLTNTELYPVQRGKSGP